MRLHRPQLQPRRSGDLLGTQEALRLLLVFPASDPTPRWRSVQQIPLEDGSDFSQHLTSLRPSEAIRLLVSASAKGADWHPFLFVLTRAMPSSAPTGSRVLRVGGHARVVGGGQPASSRACFGTLSRDYKRRKLVRLRGSKHTRGIILAEFTLDDGLPCDRA